MSAMTSQFTGVSIVYSTVCSGADERKYQSSVSLAFVGGIHQWPVNSPQKGKITLKMFPFDDVIMLYSVHSRLCKSTHRCICTWGLQFWRLWSWAFWPCRSWIATRGRLLSLRALQCSCLGTPGGEGYNTINFWLQWYHNTFRSTVQIFLIDNSSFVCVSMNWVSIGSDNGLSPIRRQSII